MPLRVSAGWSLFLSTPSARRATQGRQQKGLRVADFYPRPPRGGRPGNGLHVRHGFLISIHALREEGDYVFDEWYKTGVTFLSTPSARRATSGKAHYNQSVMRISIHALREEGDPAPCAGVGAASAISIHALREEGDEIAKDAAKEQRRFLSTPSARRATASRPSRTNRSAFLSTPSARRATGGCPRWTPGRGISIHALREEGDGGSRDKVPLHPISIHALREEGDLEE